MMSEVSRLLQQIDEEYQAARQGLTGLASGISRHTFITAKMENIQEAHEALVKSVGADKAIEIVANLIWSPEDQRKIEGSLQKCPEKD